MSSSIRSPRLNGWYRIAVLVLGVTAIVVGLLAMHVIATSSDHTGHHIAAMTHEHGDRTAMTDMSPTGAATADCNGSCESGHNMAGMVCLLALLMTTIILTVRVISRWGRDLHRLIAALSAALPAALAPPSPPSLLALSISRT